MSTETGADQGHTADLAMVDAVLAGDPDAFRSIVERDGPMILAICRRVLGELVEAEDAAQETFLVAYRRLASYRGDGPLRGWLARIAQRTAAERLRDRHVTQSIDLEDGIEVLLERLRAGSREGYGDPVAGILARERRGQLAGAIADLPQPQGEAVRLHYLDGLSYDEIATATGRPSATVRSHVHRGLTRLRSRLEAEARR
jgi:RNA polymerase sigma-70 factor, ECF subfamily